MLGGFRHPTWIMIERDLAFGPSTVNDLAENPEIGVCKRNVQRWIQQARAAGKIRIVGWERARGSPRAVYALGKGQDAPRPAPLTEAEKKRRWRAANRNAYNAYHREWEAKRRLRMQSVNV